jgi:hypothetical protein
MHGSCPWDPTRQQLGWDKRPCMHEFIVGTHEHEAKSWGNIAALEAGGHDLDGYQCNRQNVTNQSIAVHISLVGLYFLSYFL